MMEREFDYQWKNLDSPNVEYNEDRISELLDCTGLPREFFAGKYCLDAGCGNGRFTWALIQLGARVDGFDISSEAVRAALDVNPNARVADIMQLQPSRKYDFVMCWGVLHHLQNPYAGFNQVASQVKEGGYLQIMVYNKDTQKQYEKGRRIWASLTERERREFCEKMAAEKGGNALDWWDASNPKYNWSFHPSEIKSWFKKSGFEDITLVKKYNINMIARRKQKSLAERHYVDEAQYTPVTQYTSEKKITRRFPRVAIIWFIALANLLSMIPGGYRFYEYVINRRLKLKRLYSE